MILFIFPFFHDCNLSISDLTAGSEDLKCEAIYTHSIRWLPLLLLMIYIFFFNLGYGAMIWITVAEILPLHVRSVATSLAVSFTCVCSFLTSHTYNDLKGKTKSFYLHFSSISGSDIWDVGSGILDLDLCIWDLELELGYGSRIWILDLGYGIWDLGS